VAAYETEVRAERVRAGQEAGRANGKSWGGRKPGRTCKVSREKAEAIREMKARGKSISMIARTVGLSRPTVYQVLRSHQESGDPGLAS
jgi:DNA invertase Pin-like site-specific DNA recombinase